MEASFSTVLMLRNTTRPIENDRIEKEKRILSGNVTYIIENWSWEYIGYARIPNN